MSSDGNDKNYSGGDAATPAMETSSGGDDADRYRRSAAPSPDLPPPTANETHSGPSQFSVPPSSASPRPRT